MRATTVALAMTFFEAFNVPVFWPILVMYFLVLFVSMMKDRILYVLRTSARSSTH
jgi:hypothetical protein